MADAGRMLIVDDDPSVRDVLTDYFVDRGYSVITAPDGLTVLKRLREADPDVAVIMVTANEDVDLASLTLSVGAFDYVAKPFDFEHLNQTVVTAALHSARPGAGADDVWTRFVLDVFRAVRGMDAAAHASTGRRFEDAALTAARETAEAALPR